jgi:tRNA dimethylallyltransferase
VINNYKSDFLPNSLLKELENALFSFNIIVICGPTASGKTRLAIDIAGCFNGEIVSADSRQIYRGMDIGTGKDLEEYEKGQTRIPYHCIDIANPDEVYTVYRYQQDCMSAIHDIWSRRKLPVMTGGSGLYIESVLKGYDITEVPEDPDFRKTLSEESSESLKAKLKEADSSLYESTDKSSRKRIIRALEKARYSNNPPTQKKLPAAAELKPYVLCLKWPREVLIDRIDKRLEQRLKLGLVDEVGKLQNSGISKERLAMFGMEYRMTAKYLNNEISYEKMIVDLKTEIHRLAKRQMTWFRGMERRGMKIRWIDMDGFSDILLNHAV